MADNVMSLVCFALAIGAAASPFNEFIRGKFFNDRYRWRGMDRRDLVPLLKTLSMTLGFAAGAFYWIAVSSDSRTTLRRLSLAVFLTGVLGSTLFSIAYSLRRTFGARRDAEASQLPVKPEDMTHP